MNFYRRRPLALIITICLFASAAIYFLPGIFKISTLILTALLTPIIIKIIRRSKLTVICNLASTSFVLICSAFVLVTVMISFAYYDVWAARYELLTENYISATVVSVENRTPYSAVYGVRITGIGTEKVNAKGLLGTDTAIGLGVGDAIESDVLFCELDEFYDYREFATTELLSDGYVFACNTVGDVCMTGERITVEVFFSRLREQFGAKMTLYLDDAGAAFSRALFLGERGDLGKIERDFRYTGAMHLLALSGLHMTVICGTFERLLGRMRVGRGVRYIAVSLMAMFYVALTGFLSSALRAAVMLIISNLAALLRADSDRVTSLFAAVWIIVLVNPAAVFDVSLQLSFFAMLGVLLMSESADKYADIRLFRIPIVRSLRGTSRNVAAALGAVMFIMPLQWCYFGEVSLMSVPATLLLSGICELILLTLPPLLICSLFRLHFVCSVLGGAVRALSGVCVSVVSRLSEYTSLVSLEYPFVFPIMLLCIAIIAWMIVRNFSSWLYALIPFFAASAVFFGAVCVWDAVYDERVTLDFANEGSSDVITLVSDGSAAVIGLGEGSSGAAYAAMEFASKRCATDIETILLTRLNRRHISEVRTFLNNRRVGSILLPFPGAEDEMYIAADIAAIAGEYGTDTVFYRGEDANMIYGDVLLELNTKTIPTRSERPLTALRFALDGTSVSYIGASAWENEEAWRLASDAHYIIFGASGPSVKASPKDAVSTHTKVVYAADGDVAKALVPWLSAFDGEVFIGNKLSIVIEE